METERIDDGSLDFLQIPRDEKCNHFNCEEVKQSKIVNTTFWVCDFVEGIQTRYTRERGEEGKTLVKIKPEKDSPESESKKFFTGSPDILYVLRAIRERNAFPRRVTLRCIGNRFYFE